jgi:hypothetical protein
MRHLKPALIMLGGLLAAPPAFAQLMLPGAQPQSASSSVAPPAGGGGSGGGSKRRSGDGSKPAPISAPASRPPGEDAVAGRQLARNGASGVMAFDKASGALAISHLALVGYQISRPSEVCRVEVSADSPISLKSAARREGLFTFDAELEACPFSLDILDGAARVRGKTCDFVAADCRVDPAGVWGPSGAGIGPEESKTIEKTRAKAETEARASFRALLAVNKKDRARVKEIAREQASFSSAREEICRDYAREDKHGYCSSRITMAHAVALSAELHGPAGEGAPPAPTPKKKRPPKPKPVAAAPDTPPPLQ